MGESIVRISHLPMHRRICLKYTLVSMQGKLSRNIEKSALSAKFSKKLATVVKLFARCLHERPGQLLAQQDDIKLLVTYACRSYFPDVTCAPAGASKTSISAQATLSNSRRAAAVAESAQENAKRARAEDAWAVQRGERSGSVHWRGGRRLQKCRKRESRLVLLYRATRARSRTYTYTSRALSSRRAAIL